MDEHFLPTELLLRAVLPEGMFWKPDGTLSSAAFKDKEGLSVNRSGDKTLNEAVDIMKNSRLRGTIVYISVGDCYNENAVLKYLPTQKNIYHSEIHGSEERIILSNGQAKRLAGLARRAE